jgi:hypothetical protein
MQAQFFLPCSGMAAIGHDGDLGIRRASTHKVDARVLRWVDNLGLVVAKITDATDVDGAWAASGVSAREGVRRAWPAGERVRSRSCETLIRQSPFGSLQSRSPAQCFPMKTESDISTGPTVLTFCVATKLRCLFLCKVKMSLGSF